jgi:hypothetical protein
MSRFWIKRSAALAVLAAVVVVIPGDDRHVPECDTLRQVMRQLAAEQAKGADVYIGIMPARSSMIPECPGIRMPGINGQRGSFAHRAG